MKADKMLKISIEW